MASSTISKTRLLGALCSMLVACGGEEESNDSTTAPLPITSQGNTDDGDTEPTGTTPTSTDPTGSDPTDGVDTGNEDADSTDGVDTGTDSGPPPSPSCTHQCAAPADCTIGGNDFGLECLAGLCGVGCADDNYCIAASSGWLAIPCTDDGPCNGGACVDIGGGVGGCSFIPAQGACGDAGLTEMQWPSIGGGMIAVCGRPTGRCGDFDGTAACFVGCEPGGCGDMTCGADGQCHCDFDLHCVDAGLGNNCNSEGLCEVACQQASDCPAMGFDGGTVVCE